MRVKREERQKKCEGKDEEIIARGKTNKKKRLTQTTTSILLLLRKPLPPKYSLSYSRLLQSESNKSHLMASCTHWLPVLASAPKPIMRDVQDKPRRTFVGNLYEHKCRQAKTNVAQLGQQVRVCVIRFPWRLGQGHHTVECSTGMKWRRISSL
jgi:hypothetical protein